MQGKHLALPQWQAPERRTQGRERKRVARLGLRGLPLRGKLDGNPDGTPEPPAGVSGDPQRYPPDPRLRQLVAADPGPASEGTRKCLLRHVLRLMPVA